MLVSVMEDEKSYNTHLVSCLRTSNIWEGRTVIFPISHELVGILNFVLLICFMNKRTMEVQNSPNNEINQCQCERDRSWQLI